MKQTDKVDLKKGAWSPEEDQKLIAYLRKYGIWNWSQMPKAAGLSRSGKSCRLRWLNYLQPDLKRGRLTMEERETIIELHKSLGNKWSQIAAQLPGRTDNEIKNFWQTHTKKRRRIVRQRNAFKAKRTKHDEKNVADEDTSFRYVAAEIIYSESSITVAESTEFPIAESYSQSKDSCVTIEAMGSTESICSSESRGDVQETLFPEQFWIEDVCIQLMKKQAYPRSDRQLGFPISDINATIFEEPGSAHLVHEFESQGSTYVSNNNELTSFWFDIFMEATRL